MPSLTRRRALEAGALTLAGLAGCSTLADEGGERQPELVSLSVTNYRPDPVTVDVRLARNDEVVLWRLVDLDGAADEPTSTDFAPPAFPAEPGRWELSVRIPATDEQATLHLNADTYEKPCLRANVDVGPNGPLALHAGQKSDRCVGSAGDYPLMLQTG